MLILGINGLGIQPSASIVKDGKLIVFAEEERFSRVKGVHGVMPSKSVKYCLEHQGIGINDIDYIAFGWDCHMYKYKIPFFLIWSYITKASKSNSASSFTKYIHQINKYKPSNVAEEIRIMFREIGVLESLPPIKFISHHLCHAATAFYFSGFEESYVLVVDGSGENSTTSIFKGKVNHIEQIKSKKIPNSLGWFYQSFTEFLGFKPNRHEGKLMGLAPYGSYKDEISQKIDKVLFTEPNGNYCHDAKYSMFGVHDKGIVYSEKMVDNFGLPGKGGNSISQYHKDLAFGVQDKLEKTVINIVNNISNKSDFNYKLCVAGGVALNCKMNGEIIKNTKVINVFVPPIASDVGTSAGAALILSGKLGLKVNSKLEHAYYSSEYSNDEIESHLKRLGVSYTEHEEIDKVVAKILSKNYIVGWFQGKMEIGPRALGARSILANPANAEMKEAINKKIKYREDWRPFAASILYEDRHLFFDIDHDSPFMALTLEVKEEAQSLIPAAIHVDKTTRPQLVSKEFSPLYWSLIKHFKNITGVGALLNTSFNLDEEPIVENPIQAIRSFYSSELDFLAIGKFLVSKSLK